MEQLNTQLRQLADRMARREKLKTMLSDLEKQRSILSEEVEQLKQQTYKEQLDVDRLESFSAAKVLYQILGRLDEQLEKEEAEVCAVALRYDAKRKELQALDQSWQSMCRELESLKGCEKEYSRLLAEKAKRMKALNAYYGEQICALESRIDYLYAQEKELKEAIAAGHRAQRDIDGIKSSLSSAEGWGVFDLMGGGMLSDLAKHSHLDKAQQQVNTLQRSLSHFRTELADVAIQSDLRIQVDGFLRFADYFFDGLFADWAVMERIRSAKDQVFNVEVTVDNILSRLQSNLDACVREREEKKKALSELVLKA